jgi:hypothetical protein
MTSAIASATLPASWVEISAAMISESDVELKRMPRSRSSEWSSTALIRLPLCASATLWRSERWIGCALSHADEPVVE